MKKLFVTLLMVLMITSVFAESYVDLSNLWAGEKQVMAPSDEEMEEAIIYYMTCPEEEKALVLEIISVYKEQFFCVEWAEDHFKQRDGHNLTLSYEEYETYMKMRDHSLKRYTSVLDAYDASRK